MSDNLATVNATMGKRVMATLIDEIRAFPEFRDMTEEHQQKVIDRMAQHVDLAVQEGVRRILAGGFPSVTAKLTRITVDETVKAVLAFTTEELHALTDHVGSNIVVALVDPEQHTYGLDQFEVDADQPELPLGDSDE